MITGKNAIVTGSTKGIGLSTARALLKEGYFVFMSYYNDSKSANNVNEELSLNYTDRYRIDRVDLSDYNETMDYIMQLKKIVNYIDVLILNTTLTDKTPFEQMEFNIFEKVFRANVSIPFLLVQSFLGELKKGSDKCVVFTGSTMGIYPHGLSLSYGLSKSAEHSLALNLVKFLEPYEIRSNVVCPSFVETEMQKNKPKEIRESICQKVALHRFAESEEIVNAFLFIIKNKYMNGAILNIDGGYCYK